MFESPVKIKQGVPQLKVPKDHIPLLYEPEKCLYYSNEIRRKRKFHLCALHYTNEAVPTCIAEDGICPFYVPGEIPVYCISGTYKLPRGGNWGVTDYYALHSNVIKAWNQIKKDSIHSTLTISKTTLGYYQARLKCPDFQDYLTINYVNLFRRY